MLVMNKAEFISETKDAVEIRAPAQSDFFIDMFNPDNPKADAPFYYEKRKGDFTVRVKVCPEFKSVYDAGGIFVYGGPRKWIKHEFEMTPYGHPSVVMVVTDGVSDDCDGEAMPGREELWLQLARKGDNWALHFSEDGKKWKLGRYFQRKMRAEVRVGIEAQSPIGKGCTVAFSKYAISESAPADMRKGK
jgi:Uncharacterized conserved protein